MKSSIHIGNPIGTTLGIRRKSRTPKRNHLIGFVNPKIRRRSLFSLGGPCKGVVILVVAALERYNGSLDRALLKEEHLQLHSDAAHVCLDGQVPTLNSGRGVREKYLKLVVKTVQQAHIIRESHCCSLCDFARQQGEIRLWIAQIKQCPSINVCFCIHIASGISKLFAYPF